MQDTPIRTIDEITDSELEDCFDGCTDIEMVRRLIGECTDEQGWIDCLSQFSRSPSRIIGCVV